MKENKDNIEKTEYRVLARKYRPQIFKDLIGQETLVQTLTNAISSNRIAHAYILTGVRGVGKTTTARLIAMSLNCQKRKENSSEPCGNCDSCVSVCQDRNIDVIEMDAASKTGVDDVREIIENIKYKPVSFKYKIFIIDEVHMLSKSAFNALLKTLEEPPSHVKFIFATTEVKKIPITIISRCQRFDLHRVDNMILTKHFTQISEKENIPIEKDAIALIVRSSEGSVRDGLSLLDQAIANNKEKITSQSIVLMLGLADRVSIFDLMDEILKGNAVKAIESYKNIYKSGADVLMIFDEMLKVTHFLTQIKINSQITEDIHIPEAERIKGLEIAKEITISSLGLVWQVLFKGYQELQSGYNLFQHGEMIIIRLIYLYDGPSPDDLIKKIEKDIDDKKFVSSDKEISAKNNTQSTINNEKKILNNNKGEIIDSTDVHQSISIKSFREFVEIFYTKREGMLHTYLYNNIKLISFEEGKVTINENGIKYQNFSRTVAKYISKWTGRIWQVSPSSSNIGKTLYEEDLINQQKEIEVMKNDSEIKDILKKYPKVKIHSITNIIETTDKTNSNKKAKKLKET